jgi:hypothetical protein
VAPIAVVWEDPHVPGQLKNTVVVAVWCGAACRQHYCQGRQ